MAHQSGPRRDLMLLTSTAMFRALLGIATNTGRVVCRVDGIARATVVHYTVNQTGKTSFCC